MKISINKALKSLIGRDLHKINIDSNHQNVLSNFKQKIQTIQALNNNSEATIDTKLAGLKEKVKTDKTNAKNQIDKLAEEILSKITAYENESKSSLTSYTKLIADMNAKFSDYEKCLRSLNNTDEDRKTKSGEIQDSIKVLDTEIYNYKNIFNENRSIEYEPMKANVRNFFGKLKVFNPGEIQQKEPLLCSLKPAEDEIQFIDDHEFNDVVIKIEPKSHAAQPIKAMSPPSSNYIFLC